MIKLFRALINRFYNEKIESFCVRLLYFFNTINTYFLVSGLIAFLFVLPDEITWIPLVAGFAVAVAVIYYADFHPTFFLTAGPGLLLYCWLSPGAWPVFGIALLVNTVFYYTILTLFMSIPESIVARMWWRIVLRKFVNSAFTIAPTTVSLSMSVSFSLLLTISLTATQKSFCAFGWDDFLLWSGMLLGAALSKFLRPRTFISKFFMPKPMEKPFDRVVILNIDGCRMDVMRQESLPNVQKAEAEGSSLPGGLTTVYRALTNPAFASILTGAPPQKHGIKDNNFGQSIGIEALPDIVPTILYGSMHVAHFSKPEWDCRIVSLPERSVWKSDSVVQEQLLNDLKNRDDVRLFVMDYSEADFLAHAFGSTSEEYRSGLRNIDTKIGKIRDFIASDDRYRTAIIICSDHGVVAIDHSYLLFDAEKYVPFIISGPGIQQGYTLEGHGSIMDIGCTAAYLLGIRYPEFASGRVFSEILTENDQFAEREALVSEVNKIYYNTVSSQYDERHPEVVEGDFAWWLDKFSEIHPADGNPLRVLDFGCGTGFIGKALAASSLEIGELTCLDTSSGMLEQARQALSPLWETSVLSFAVDMAEIQGRKFDLICVNSVLHHLHNPLQVTRELETLLADGGRIMGAHEPNKEFFNSITARLLASAYKRAGQGISLPEDILSDFNNRFKTKFPWAPFLRADAVLQTVENHSPVEQDEVSVPSGVGFGKMLVSDFYPSLETLESETYTTAFVRDVFKDRPGLTRMLETAFKLVFPSGNLIRYIAHKPARRKSA
ncbi:alkaline phosphatase family protein [Desulfobacter vibrioformis]|uniref:alkaline phosphatase family protein n=1 Tax=Desulfobacter vibrioformis TaxID=34031 RepID=UPI000552D4F5|nr:alkaline phosphatase family protein [Desulfobacter vibrioformis]